MSIRNLLPGLLLFSILLQCTDAKVTSQNELVDALSAAIEEKDAGGVMNLVDVHYQDALGGPGRLETDLRQLFAVYGGLLIKIKDGVSIGEETISGTSIIEGKHLRFEGPIHLSISRWPSGILVRSGLLTDLRSILSALRERRVALESKSCDRLASVVSPKYGGIMDGRNKLMTKLEKEYQNTGTSAMLVDSSNISVDLNQAQVIQSFLLITRIGDKREENRRHEKLILHKEGSLWRFTEGLD